MDMTDIGLPLLPSSIIASFLMRSYSNIRRIWSQDYSHAPWFRHLTRSLSISIQGERHRQLQIPDCTQSRCSSSHFAASGLSSLSLARFFSKTVAAKHAKQQQRELKSSSFNPYGFKIGLFGRPNVGKSTLYNRLAGRKAAIVDVLPGVTRDRSETRGYLAGLEFTIIDTAGLEAAHNFLHSNNTAAPSDAQLINQQPPSFELQTGILDQTRQAILDCDVALFIFDARIPITAEDLHFSRWLKKQRTTVNIDEQGRRRTVRSPIILIANKVEGDTDDYERYPGLMDQWQLGLGEAVEMSAEHGQGLAMLHNELDAHFTSLMDQKMREKRDRESAAQRDAEQQKQRIHFAIVGKPNVGKSSLVNALLGEQRVLVGPQAGITRDAIKTEYSSPEHPDHIFTMIDTAGIKGGVITRSSYQRVDQAAMTASLRAIDMANTVCLMIDITDGLRPANMLPDKQYSNEDEEALLVSRVKEVLHQQDLTIAKRITDEGRGLVIIANKVDQLTASDRRIVMKGLRLLLNQSLPQVKGVDIIPLSALHRDGVHKLIPAVISTFDRWSHRVSTQKLNAWLHAFQQYKPHPAYKGKPVKVRYMAQVASRPPTFAVFVSGAGIKVTTGGALQGLSEVWIRLLRNTMVKEFNLIGINIRLRVRKGEKKDKAETAESSASRNDEEGEIRLDAAQEEEDAIDTDIVVRDSAGRMDHLIQHQHEAEEEEAEEDQQDNEDLDRYMTTDEVNEAMEAQEEMVVDDEEDHRGSLEMVPFQSPSSSLPSVVTPFVSDILMNVPSPSSNKSSPGFLHPAPALYRPSRPSFIVPHSLSSLVAPPARKMLVTWEERREVQQKKQFARSTAIKRKKAIATFQNAGAYYTYVKAEQDRKDRWNRKQAKIRVGRETKMQKGRTGEDHYYKHAPEVEGEEQEASTGNRQPMRPRGYRQYSR